MISVGAPAPPVELPAQGGQARFRLADWRGRKNVLLLFLPAAFTPICSTEVPALGALLERFWTEADTLPVAVTVDNTAANLAWARDCGAGRLMILSDFWPHGAVSRAYGVLAADGVAERSTAIVDKQGVVRFAEVAGRYGQRSIPALLEIARAINVGRSPPNPLSSAIPSAVLPKLDLPRVYVTQSCPHCRSVRGFLAESGLSKRVVVREVDQDPAAMRELLAREPRGSVPLLVLPDGTRSVGDLSIIHDLKRIYRL